MNISTGGPHILFFERDQQLAALLTSEFQLAGYECHAARTAVEVFDTIARYPVRILLVNLAQAAAGRREFWVALDTQRRGRGVQVLTYRCSKIAGYGPKDSDERSQMTADLEIEGMLGVMNLVDEVRERVPGSSSVSSTTNTMPRIARVTPPPPPNTPVLASQPTQAQMNTNGTAYRPGSVANMHGNQAPRASSAISSTVPQTPPTGAGINQQSYSDKIRAVLYPTQRPASPQGNGADTQNMQPAQEIQQPAYNYDMQNTQSIPSMQNGVVTQSYDSGATMLQHLAYGQNGTEGQRESGLDQLSRMVQERQTLSTDGASSGYSYQAANSVSNGRSYTTSGTPPTEQNFAATTAMSYAPPSSQVAGPIGTQPLRASPIEDLPIERTVGGQTAGERRSDGSMHTGYSPYGYAGQPQANQAPAATPLASISTLVPPTAPSIPAPAMSRSTVPIPAVMPMQQTPPTPVSAPPASTTPEPLSPPVPEAAQPVQPVVEERVEESIRNDDEGEPTGNIPVAEYVEDEEEQKEVSNTFTSTEQLQQEQASMQDALNWREDPKTDLAPNNAMLLDIVQSLPMMPSSPQPSQPTPSQTVSGRTMRSLGSVLLEGHLVPQSRLEVAQNVQRMLRGVDLNYQLGEILLMFKLLTPDQLLAASLVSYGMISTQQISALSRIRQELHSIGLEYDLESLLILFRMLTPEQLREVRASWQG